MPWIQNVSKQGVKLGNHKDPGPNALLIQITDPGTEFVVPKFSFKEVVQFSFLDVEEDGMTNMGDGTLVDMSEFAITQNEAKSIVAALKHALANDMNVVVHCVAGIARSGAVCEVGVMMGFDDTNAHRNPNMLVKKLLMRELGWLYY